jgi:hypothetical protein
MQLMTHHRFRRSISVFLALAILTTSAVAQTWKTLKPGVEYAELRHEFGGQPVDIDLLRLDLTKVRIDVEHAMDKAIGLETTSSIATRHKAVAAINAGFFRLDTSRWAGDAAGILQVNGRLLSEPSNDRIQLLINNAPRRTDTFIERLAIHLAVKSAGGTLPIRGINRELKADDFVLYTPEFGATTLTSKDSIEVVVSGRKVAMAVKDMGNSEIPRNGMVLSATGTYRDALARIADEQADIQLSRVVDNRPSAVSPDVIKYPSEWDIVAGVPQLIKNGKIDITWEQEKAARAFVENRHPRTAVAKLKDGKFLMMTVDGRTEQSAGASLRDLADYLLSLGAIEAMNLDGGGSTTMWVDGRIVNRPSDREGERKVSDALIVTLRSATSRPKGRR